jgi:hypothetical protein
MHVNNIFLFFKNYFWHQHIKTIQNIQTVLNFSKKQKKIEFYRNVISTAFPNTFNPGWTAHRWSTTHPGPKVKGRGIFSQGFMKMELQIKSFRICPINTKSNWNIIQPRSKLYLNQHVIVHIRNKGSISILEK